MGEANGTGHGPAGGGATADREALLRAAGWAFVHERPPVPTADEVRRFEADFLRPVREWCAAHADKVKACYVASPRRQVGVFVIRQRLGYDPAFQNDLIGLRGILSAAGWRWVEVMAFVSDDPDEWSGSFDPSEALEVYANRRPAPQEV